MEIIQFIIIGCMTFIMFCMAIMVFFLVIETIKEFRRNN